jgi:uncharacterized small protein (DUF1192 family)
LLWSSVSEIEAELGCLKHDIPEVRSQSNKVPEIGRCLMTTQRNGLQLDPAQVERIRQATSKDGEVRELSIEELEERIAPLWNRRYY